VVGLVHRSCELPGAQVQVGDATDPAVVVALLADCDAVISALGPGRASPPDFSSAAGRALLHALDSHHITRVAVVTGAMSGDVARLGPFYRWAVAAESLQPVLDDRRTQEQELLAAGLELSLVRPPRLSSGGESVGGPLVARAPVVQSLDHCSRDDLAATLLRAVTVEPLGDVYVRSRTTKRSFWRRWLLACGLAELSAIGIAGAVAVGMMSAFGEPSTPLQAALVLLAFVGVGLFEGALIGAAQGLLLAQRLRGLRLSRFAGWTAAVAALAWALGMAPSLFFAPEAAAVGAEPFDPPLILVIVASAVGGAFGGLLIGGAQAIELRHHVDSVRPWILATVLAWTVALPIDVLGASILPADASMALAVGSGVLHGLLAGLVFAIPTGWVAWRETERA